MWRVMVIDDEVRQCKGLKNILLREFQGDMEVWDFTMAAEALAFVHSNEVDIIITDICMPEMDGLQFMEEAAKENPGIKVILLTGYAEFEYARKALTLGALDYLLKPCEEEELVAVMEEAMRLTDKRLAGQDASGPDSPGPDSPGPYITGPDVRAGEPAQDMSRDDGDGRLAQVAETIREYIRNNYMKEISMQDAARVMNYSDAYFCKLFKQCFDQNFTSYLTNFRVNEAKKLLKDRNISVKDVGMRVGYYDSNYFAKVFKRVTGVIPSEYRDSQHSIRHGDANRPT